MIRRRLIATAFALAMLGAVVGAAASLALTAQSVGAATATTPRCVTSALTITPVLTTGNVTSVVVATLPAGCGGATLKVAVDNGAASGTGSATVPGGGGSVTVPITAGPAIDVNVSIDIVLEGP